MFECRNRTRSSFGTLAFLFKRPIRLFRYVSFSNAGVPMLTSVRGKKKKKLTRFRSNRPVKSTRCPLCVEVAPVELSSFFFVTVSTWTGIQAIAEEQGRTVTPSFVRGLIRTEGVRLSLSLRLLSRALRERQKLNEQCLKNSGVSYPDIFFLHYWSTHV